MKVKCVRLDFPNGAWTTLLPLSFLALACLSDFLALFGPSNPGPIAIKTLTLCTPPTTMTERFLISYDPFATVSEAGSIQDISAMLCLGNQLVTVQPGQFQSAIQYLRNEYSPSGRGKVIYCNANPLDAVEEVISLLDHGATKVFVSTKHLKEIVEGRLVEDLSRLVLCLNQGYPETDPEGIVQDVQGRLRSLVCETGVGIHIRHTNSGSDCKLLEVLHEYVRGAGSSSRIYVEHVEDSREIYVNAIKAAHVPIVAASRLTIKPEQFPDLIPADFIITAALQTDRPDGLYATVVSDERGVCLGLVYSNEESIRAAINSGRGVYYSRSRKGLWIKGATSGDTQQLISVGLDCDGDALQFTVRQRGKGRIKAPCEYASRLKGPRFLPSPDCNVLWSLLWPSTLGADVAASQSFGTFRFVHSKAL